MQLPPDVIRCAPHDHILERVGSLRRVWLVEDVVGLQRLAVLEKDGRVVDVMERAVDSADPPYHDEIYLLLTAYARDFASREAAAEAVSRRALGGGVHGVCRSIARFPAATCEVIRPADVARTTGT